VTIPANLAIALHPEIEYAVVSHAGEYFVVAQALKDKVGPALGWTDAAVAATVPGRQLENLQARHPFLDRPSPIVLADYVTTESGTGAVHTAPATAWTTTRPG